jgi:hypothetical protein
MTKKDFTTQTGGRQTGDDERSVSLCRFRPRTADDDEDPNEESRDDAAHTTADSDLSDPEVALRWLRTFTPPAIDPNVSAVSAGFPPYLRQAVDMVGEATGCDVQAYTAIGALHRGVVWIERQPEVGRIRRARQVVERAGWSTEPLDWKFSLRSGEAHIELRRVGSEHRNRVFALMDVLGLSQRATAGLSVLIGVVDLKLRGAAGRQATETAKDFLAQLESRLVLAEDLARRAARDPAPITSVSLDQLRSTRHR